MNQHRRELNTNELDKLAQKAAPFLEKHGNTILYSACGLLIAFAIFYYYSKTSSSADATAWTAYRSAQTPEDFAKVADTYRDRSVADWARVNEAEMYLNQSVQGMFRDRAGAVSDLNKAKESFESILKKGSLPEPVHERALFGLARCLETLSTSDTSAAVKAYEAFLDKFPESIYAKTCQERINLLTSDEGKEFYAWFAAQNPKPEDIKRPQDGLPPGHPSVDPGSLIFLPPIPDLLQLPDETPSAPMFPTETPAESSTGPAAPATPEDPAPKGTAPTLPEDAPK